MSSDTAQVAHSGSQPCLTMHPERSEEEFGFVKELMLEKNQSGFFPWFIIFHVQLWWSYTNIMPTICQVSDFAGINLEEILL